MYLSAALEHIIVRRMQGGIRPACRKRATDQGSIDVQFIALLILPSLNGP
jgi:hypothetical protein